MRIIDAVRALELPSGEYLVCGSGILDALGVREAKDVDLLVTPRAFEELRKRGWEYRDVEIDGRRRERLTLGAAEAYTDLWYGDVRVEGDAALAAAEVIEGIPFQSLEELLKMKRGLGREKDRRDITLIEKLLEERGT